ncbi:MAG: type II toxin-antitoxin system RelE/ParE family toxin [Nitrospirae bacterium]|nr:type II toxin-antitoxin system RelE/ParE family toxin [Nitrospirota bacterium]
MKVVITGAAKRDLANLDKTLAKRIAFVIDQLAAKPETIAISQLRGKPKLYKVRVGQWRIILSINHESETAYIVRVRHRRDAYKMLWQHPSMN